MRSKLLPIKRFSCRIVSLSIPDFAKNSGHPTSTRPLQCTKASLLQYTMNTLAKEGKLQQLLQQIQQESGGKQARAVPKGVTNQPTERVLKQVI